MVGKLLLSSSRRYWYFEFAVVNLLPSPERSLSLLCRIYLLCSFCCMSLNNYRYNRVTRLPRSSPLSIWTAVGIPLKPPPLGVVLRYPVLSLVLANGTLGDFTGMSILCARIALLVTVTWTTANSFPGTVRELGRRRMLHPSDTIPTSRRVRLETVPVLNPLNAQVRFNRVRVIIHLTSNWFRLLAIGRPRTSVVLLLGGNTTVTPVTPLIGNRNPVSRWVVLVLRKVVE